MKTLFRLITLIVILTGIVPLAGVQGQTSPTPKKVLVLFPYQAHLPYSTLAVQTIQQEFNAATDLDLELFYEYLDLSRFPDDAYRQQLEKLYAIKYHHQPIDLVIVVGEGMLDFWLQHQNQILPSNPPVVLFDITAARLAKLKLPPNVVGIGGEGNYIPSVNWILQARPAVDEIVLVYGVGKADQTFIGPIHQIKQTFQNRVKLTDLSGLSLTEIKRRVAALPESSVVLYHLMFEDAHGAQYVPLQALREIAQVSAVPVISGYDHFIGTGTIGGSVYSIEHQAKEAARLGLRILRGEPVSTISIVANQSNPFIFDHLALQRYNIPLSSLPPGSIIKNRQYSMWERYQPQVIIAGISFVLLILLVVVLTGLNRRLNTTRLTLSQTNRHLEAEIGERIRIEAEREQLITELQETLAKIKQLEGILPICSFCKKIRDEDGNWQAMESYITGHSQAEFSHSFCPECAKKYYPGYFSESTEG